jgi:hypothetical protein
MRFAASLILLLFVVEGPVRPEPAVPYFTNVRDVQIAQADRQNFFIVDEELWNHSHGGLADLRLYDGDSVVQYAISEQRAGVSSEEVDAKILNLGSVSGHTEFDLDTNGLPEYDRVRLRLDAQDFVATASVSGGSAPGKAAEVQLTPSTLYDFTKEQLGSNSQLKLPASSFRYLHIVLSPGIRPQQVKGAAIYNLRSQQARWTKVGSCAAPQQKPHLTVITCVVPERVPLSRIAFHIDPAQVNFRRTVSVEDAQGRPFASGEISRVRINRGGTLVTNEELSLNVSGNSGQITINIDNGDNPPLTITSAEPLSLERRIYFDPQGKGTLKLYYGDSKLDAPIYDYARFFHADPSPAEAQLAPGAHNPQYTGRPDERPWSERHPGILWTAMTVAVLALMLLALRGLRTQSSS